MYKAPPFDSSFSPIAKALLFEKVTVPVVFKTASAPEIYIAPPDALSAPSQPGYV